MARELACRWIRGLAAMAMVFCAGSADAQSRPAWIIEVHGGGTLVGITTAGDAQLPPPGGPFTTVAGGPSMKVSSWLFGDGARLANDVMAAKGLAGRVSGLDPLLARSAGYRHALTFGLRVGRVLGRRLRAEASVDYLRNALRVSEETEKAARDVSGSFVTAWNSLLTGGPFITSSVTSTAAADGVGHQLLVIGALAINLLSPVPGPLPIARRFMPFATVGGGVLAGGDDPLQVTIRGQYRFTLASRAQIFETDTVSVRFVTPERTFVGVVGGGVTYDATRHVGLRAEARLHLAPSRITTTLSTSPLAADLTPTGVIASETSPSIQFSNDPAVASTLSGPAVTDFETFRSSGLNRHLTLTGGLFVRF